MLDGLCTWEMLVGILLTILGYLPGHIWLLVEAYRWHVENWPGGKWLFSQKTSNILQVVLVVVRCFFGKCR